MDGGEKMCLFECVCVRMCHVCARADIFCLFVNATPKPEVVVMLKCNVVL